MHQCSQAGSTNEAEQRRCVVAAIVASGISLLAFATQQGVSVARAELLLQQASVEGAGNCGRLG